jgi:5'(3')-deoxyribonucleotidase
VKKNIAIDIDNILWDFSPVFWERLQRINPDIVPPSIWNRWDFWQNYVTKKQLYGVIKGIHLDQEQFAPFADAKCFLTSLREKGFHIVIASHREPETREMTVRWLDSNQLPYDEIHLSNDKSAIFQDVCAIVDDSPSVLDKARDAGIIRVGLRRPWNMQTDHPLFDTLKGIFAYIESQCDSGEAPEK